MAARITKTKTESKPQSSSAVRRFAAGAGRRYQASRRRVGNFLMRRPHRSFRRTRRRDYVRSLQLPGYWAFTNSVRTMLMEHKRLFGLLVLTYVIATVFFVGMGSQATYTSLSTDLREAGSQVFDGDWSELNQAGTLLLTGMSGAFGATPDPVQQLSAVLLMVFIWLTTVWLLRAIVAGRRPKLRDGLYSAGAPLVATLLVTFVGLVQLIPVLVGIIALGAATGAGLLTGGVEAMLFWTAFGGLSLLSLYWLTSTFLALVIITLPGMYPMEAIKAAGDLVIGRRVRVLLRMLWLGLLLLVLWVVIMLPVILFDAWVKGVWPAIEWVPLVPFGLVVTSSLTVTVAAVYVYLLYRGIVDDDAAPA